MGEEFTRRQYLAAAGGAVALAGCNEGRQSTDTPDRTESAKDTPAKTLVVPTDTATIVTPTATLSETPTEAGTPATTPTATVIDSGTSSGSQPAPSGRSGGPAPTPSPAATGELVIEAGETEAASEVSYYSGVEWHDTGRLVIEDGAGFGLRGIQT